MTDADPLLPPPNPKWKVWMIMQIMYSGFGEDLSKVPTENVEGGRRSALLSLRRDAPDDRHDEHG